MSDQAGTVRGTSQVLERLFEVVEDRSARRPEDSYVARLLEGGDDLLGAKLREEAEEAIDAMAARDSAHAAREVADLIFHVWVYMAAAGVRPEQVWQVLEDRFGTGGLVEKASRESGSKHVG